MLVMIDNFDSFTYNLYQYLMQMGAEVRVARNTRLTVEELEGLAPRGLIISPGPGRPESAGVTLPAIRKFSGRIPILGVCLGHQAIALAFGGRIVSARHLMHGKTSNVTADGRTLFQGIPSPFQAMRYHSLAVARDPLPGCLEISAESDDGEIMGLRHRSHPTEGVQFHPESIMTPAGKRILRNFLKMTHQPIPV
jgi:anthranilate synthase/aminodeoxychorismate synthase-like glutamine amidotransferase